MFPWPLRLWQQRTITTKHMDVLTRQGYLLTYLVAYSMSAIRLNSTQVALAKYGWTKAYVNRLVFQLWLNVWSTTGTTCHTDCVSKTIHCKCGAEGQLFTNAKDLIIRCLWVHKWLLSLDRASTRYVSYVLTGKERFEVTGARFHTLSSSFYWLELLTFK